MLAIVFRTFLVVLALAWTGFSAYAQQRVALVVGNSDYQHTTKLENPRNDAEDVTERLKSLGFEVIGGVDLDRRALVGELIRFGRAAEKADVALFFYAGHGLQVNGQNYLVPVDALVEFEAEIDISLVSLSGVMQQLERGSKTNLVFLDACRDNPFAKDLAKTINRGAMSLSKGLGRVQSDSGTFIAFATQPDAVASDGSGAKLAFHDRLAEAHRRARRRHFGHDDRGAQRCHGGNRRQAGAMGFFLADGQIRVRRCAAGGAADQPGASLGDDRKRGLRSGGGGWKLRSV